MALEYDPSDFVTCALLENSFENMESRVEGQHTEDADEYAHTVIRYVHMRQSVFVFVEVYDQNSRNCEKPIYGMINSISFRSGIKWIFQQKVQIKQNYAV